MIVAWWSMQWNRNNPFPREHNATSHCYGWFMDYPAQAKPKSCDGCNHISKMCGAGSRATNLPSQRHWTPWQATYKVQRCTVGDTSVSKTVGPGKKGGALVLEPIQQFSQRLVVASSASVGFLFLSHTNIKTQEEIPIYVGRNETKEKVVSICRGLL